MAEFWETAFTNKQEMWGLQPANSAISTSHFFKETCLKNVLIPGIGYGRNAKPFIENGMQVSGIEISKTAITLAQKYYGTELDIIQGSVTQMPFIHKKYDGIFCHALIHLLDVKERKKLLQDCYDQLTENGYMVFTAITKKATQFGKGNVKGNDRYELHKGAAIFYYDIASATKEFQEYGLVGIVEVDENQPMYLITCKKEKISGSLKQNPSFI